MLFGEERLRVLLLIPYFCANVYTPQTFVCKSQDFSLTGTMAMLQKLVLSG